jgi:hypothetical protein
MLLLNFTPDLWPEDLTTLCQSSNSTRIIHLSVVLTLLITVLIVASPPSLGVRPWFSLSTRLITVRGRKGYSAHFNFGAVNDEQSRSLRKIWSAPNRAKLLQFRNQLAES